MAGNGDREVVRRARAGDGADRLRCSDTTSDFAVGNRLAEGNFLERLPYAPLEGGTADVERKIEAHPRPLDETDNACHQRLVVAICTNETRSRKAILEIANELVR